MSLNRIDWGLSPSNRLIEWFKSQSPPSKCASSLPSRRHFARMRAIPKHFIETSTWQINKIPTIGLVKSKKFIWLLPAVTTGAKLHSPVRGLPTRDLCWSSAAVGKTGDSLTSSTSKLPTMACLLMNLAVPLDVPCRSKRFATVAGFAPAHNPAPGSAAKY